MKVLVCASGSVAAVKVPEIVVRLSEAFEVRVIWTKSASHFLGIAKSYDPGSFLAYEELIKGDFVKSYVDADEWSEYNDVRRNPVVHIKLRKWADLLLIAPLSANSLAKLANGLCDNLLSCVYRAWDISRPVILAPAMNTLMWHHPLTDRQLRAVKEIHGDKLRVVGPVIKTLACGDTGAGALATVEEIVTGVTEALEMSHDNLTAVKDPQFCHVFRPASPCDAFRIAELYREEDQGAMNEGEHYVYQDCATGVVVAVVTISARPQVLVKTIDDSKYLEKAQRCASRYRSIRSDA